METLKKIVTNQYFPAAAVLTAVLMFWIIAMFGGLSLLNNNQPPMATLTWMLFVYAAAVLTPLAGILAGMDLVRRWRRNRMYAQVEMVPVEMVQDEQVQEPAAEAPEAEASRQSAPKQAAQHGAATQQRHAQHPVQQPAKQQPAQAKQRKRAA